MAFSFSQTKRAIANGVVMIMGTWNAASVTSGNITHPIRNVYYSAVNNKTEARGAFTDSTLNTIAISSVTSNDVGNYIVIGHE